MNVLIITPLDPMDTMEVYLECTLHMNFDSSIFFSIPAMALLGEETMKDSDMQYEKLLSMFLNSFHRSEIAKNMFKKDNIQIFIGTLPTNVVKPDYIISMIPPYKEIENNIDPIIEKLNLTTGIYTLQDADLTFPTYHHLEKFLEVLSLPKRKQEEKGDISELQSETANSSRQ